MDNNGFINLDKTKRTVLFLGVAFLILTLTLVILTPNPRDAAVYNMFKLLSALGAAGFISGVTGFFFIKINDKLFATEAFAIFLLVFYFYPIYDEGDDLNIIDVSGCTINNNHEKQCNIKVNKRTVYILKKGDTLRVLSTSGSISLGFIVGKSKPEGIDKGIFGLSLEKYCIAANIKHGALMYKLGEGNWKEVKSDQIIVSTSTQIIQFDVNDREQGNNDGEYLISFKDKAD